MCKAMDDMRKEAARVARIQAFAIALPGIIRMFGLDADKAMDAANVPPDLRSDVLDAMSSTQTLTVFDKTTDDSIFR